MQTLRFEDQVAMLYSQRGNRIEREVKKSQGVSDLFLLSSKGEKWIVRCVNLGEVDSSIAHDLIQLMQSEKAQQGSIITRGIINSSVAQLVKGKPIHLVDGKKLQDYLDRLQPEPQQHIQATQPTLKQFVGAKSGTAETASSQAAPLQPSSDQAAKGVVITNLSASESAAPTLKPCPYCAEMIQKAAIICRFCGRSLADNTLLTADMRENVSSSAGVQKVEIASVNIAPKNPAKMRRVITGVVAAVVVLILGFVTFSVLKNNDENQKYNAYIDNLMFASQTMLDGGSKAESLLDLTARVWYNTIYEKHDTETDKYTKDAVVGISFNSDFNTSLSALFSASTTKSTISTIESNQALVEPTMKDFQNPPAGLENCYNTVTDLYSTYKSLTDLAINPSGSLQSFTENKAQKIDKFLELFQKLKTQIPEKK